MVGTILAMLIMRNYTITEERSLEIRSQLAKQKEIKNNE
jgi:Na+/melibiose symporter-like transporter